MLSVANASVGKWVTFQLRNGGELAGRLKGTESDPTSADGPVATIDNKDGRGYVRLAEVSAIFVSKEGTA